jgi:hypothetical protein
MRHTLLPLQERIVLRREYYIRINIVFCFLLSLAIFVGISALFPVYIKAISTRSEFESQVKKTNNDVDQKVKEVQKSIANSLSILDSLNKESNSVLISDIIGGIINMKGNLKFSSISASKVSTSTFMISVQGIAPDRNSLLNFKKSFENMSPKNKVELPVSSLAKSTNIQFSLQLKEELQ